jgi:F0F1-type ATP synthase epsilon subunit
MPDLRLTVISPLGKFIDNEPVDYFRLQLSNGCPLSIYPLHAPLIARLDSTKAEYQQSGSRYFIQIDSGVLRVFKNKIICAVESADRIESGNNA